MGMAPAALAASATDLATSRSMDRLDLGCLDQHPDSLVDSNYTLRYYGKPVYDPLPVSDPDKATDSDFSDLSEAAEKVVKAMNMIRERCTVLDRGGMSTGRKRSLKSTATVMMGSLMGAQAIQEDETWRSVSGVWTQSPMVMACMIITAIIVILIGRWMTKTSRTTKKPQPVGVVDVLHKDELFRKIVEFSGFENKYWRLAAIHRDCLWHRDSLLNGLAEERELEARAREADEIGTAERDHVANDTGFRIPAEGDIRCSREHRRRLIEVFGEDYGRQKQRRIQQAQRDQQAWREQRAQTRAKRQPRIPGEELGVNTSESSSDEGYSERTACAMFETGADTMH